MFRNPLGLTSRPSVMGRSRLWAVVEAQVGHESVDVCAEPAVDVTLIKDGGFTTFGSLFIIVTRLLSVTVLIRKGEQDKVHSKQSEAQNILTLNVQHH